MKRRYFSNFRIKRIMDSINTSTINEPNGAADDDIITAASAYKTPSNFLPTAPEPMSNNDTIFTSTTELTDKIGNTYFPTEPQPSTSNTAPDNTYNYTALHNFTERSDDLEEDLITLSDLDDSVADVNYIPSDFNESSSSDENVSSSTNFLSKYLKPRRARQHETQVISDENNKVNDEVFIARYPSPIYTAKDAITEDNNTSTINNIFVAGYPGPIFANEKDAQENYVKTSKRSHKQKSKHSMIIETCTGKCNRKCTSFSLGDRIQIWSNYWDLNFQSKRNFLNKCIQITGVKKRRVNVAGNADIIKKESRFYYFPKSDSNDSIPVCRKFFLDTLGCTTDGIITGLSKALRRGNLFGEVLKDKRGGNRNEIPKSIIEQHILSYQPVVSHYRRHNAPNVRYLPRYLTLKQMHEDFKRIHPNFRCGLEVYRQTIKRLNISFNMPKGDKCADCSFYEEESKRYTEKGDEVPEDIRTKEKEHNEKVNLAIERYRLDGAKGNERRIKYFSMDLQKVVLIPEMPQYKDAFFLSRLITFNLTFAPIQKKSLDPAICVLWHEAIAGRDASNIVDAIKAFLDNQRDVQHFHLWADNCTAQNKNWTLFTAMVMVVNNEVNDIESITINYLTKGHTHMAADAVHANIEQRMRRERNLYDFGDFKDCVLRSRKNIKILEILHRHNWPKKKRAGRLGEPLREFQLKSVVQVKFVKGSKNLFYKTRFDENLQELDFLQKKFDVQSPVVTVEEPRGVKEIKKNEIISKLLPMMPESRKSFWRNLPTNNQSADLSFVDQMEAI